MHTDSFPQLLFDKVYKEDIERLRSMEDMWKNRRPPECLDYKTVLAKMEENDAAPKDIVLRVDQRPWTMEENVFVFSDR